MKKEAAVIDRIWTGMSSSRNQETGLALMRALASTFADSTGACDRIIGACHHKPLSISQTCSLKVIDVILPMHTSRLRVRGLDRKLISTNLGTLAPVAQARRTVDTPRAAFPKHQRFSPLLSCRQIPATIDLASFADEIWW